MDYYFESDFSLAGQFLPYIRQFTVACINGGMFTIRWMMPKITQVCFTLRNRTLACW